MSESKPRRRLSSVVAAGLLVAAIGLALYVWRRSNLVSIPASLSPAVIPSDAPISIALTGDTSIFKNINDRDPVFAPLFDVIRGATIGFTNLEVNLLDRDRAREAELRPMPHWVFGTADQARRLRALGFDMVSLANNHALDFGPEGLMSTLHALDEAGMWHAGAGADLAAARAAVFAGTDARKVALIAVSASGSAEVRASASQPNIQGRAGVNPLQDSADVTVDSATYQVLAQSVVTLNAGPPPGEREMTMFGARIRRGDQTHVDLLVNEQDEREVLEQVRAARTRAEIVVVSVHTHEPSNVSDEPADFIRRFARDAIDAGAHVVVGHGPHRVRALEIYHGALILYSLGNFIYQNDGLDFRAADAFDAGRNLYGLALGAAGSEVSPLAQLESDWWWQAVVAVPTFDRGGLAGVKIYPIDLGLADPPGQRGVPRLARGERARAILQRFSEISGGLAPSPVQAETSVLDVAITKDK